mgnify:CR=1 FL=1
MKFVLFKREVSYPIEDKRSLKRLVDIDKIFLFRESGTLIDPTITLVMYNGYMFEFNKIEYENEVYDCYDSDDALYALACITDVC